MTISRKVRSAALALAIVGAGVAAYWPALQAGFVWDDHLLLGETAVARGPLWRIWFSGDATDYWPLTWTTLWAEVRVWGDSPAPYHLANVALHVAASVLLWRLLAALPVPGAALAGLLFAVHPVGVESVAWVSERKNVLSAVFFFGSLLAWARFDDGGRRRDASISFSLYLLALLAKTSVVMLPFVQLGIALYRRRTITRRDLARAAPFFLLSALFGAATWWFQNENVVRGEIAQRGLAERMAGSAWALGSYLQKAFLPLELAIVYPRWPVDPASPAFWIPAVLLVVGVCVAWALGRRAWARPALFSLGYHALMVLPILGLLDMAYFAVGPVSNHLQYLALAAPAALAGGGVALLYRLRRGLAVGAGVALVLALAVQTHRRAAAFEDDFRLWEAAVRESPRSLYAALAFSQEVGARTTVADALDQLTAFIDRSPDEADRHLARAYWLVHMKLPAEAASEAIAGELIRPDVQRQIEIAKRMVNSGYLADAMRVLNLQVERAPRSADVRYWLAAALVRSGHPEEARQVVLDGLRVSPRDRKLQRTLTFLDEKSRSAPRPGEVAR